MRPRTSLVPLCCCCNLRISSALSRMAKDYLHESISFKVKKVARYARLYGSSRTLAKIRGQVHMSESEAIQGAIWRNPACRKPDHPARGVAIVGSGNFAYTVIAYYLKGHAKHFLRAALDVNLARACSLCRDYGGCYATTQLEDILQDKQIKLVYIASNHASHAEYAIACLDAGKDVHIEKPQAVSWEQLDRLISAQKRNSGRLVFLGYNRPRSRHFAKVLQTLHMESGPIMINWFIAGHEIPPDHWYFAEAEGGRVLGNLCHWTDLTLAMVGRENALPAAVVPVSAPGSPSDFCVGIQFADGSVAGITFSAKGHTFEGVREVLNVQKGNALISMTDFHRTRIDVMAKRHSFRTLFRDHGHKANILNSYQASRDRSPDRAVSAAYNRATAQLMLAVRSAIETGQRVTLNEHGTVGF